MTIYFCPDVDVDEFKDKCMIPLFPNEWNYWEVWVTDKNLKIVLNPREPWAIKTVMQYWFFYWGDIHDIQISTEPFANNEVKYDGEACPLLKPNLDIRTRHYRFFVKFVYRGSFRWMPLPTYTHQLYEKWCPVDCHLMVKHVFSPIREEIPEQPSILKEFVEEGLHLDYDKLKESLPTIEVPEFEWADPRESVTGALLWGGLGIGLAAFVISKFKD